MNSESLLEKNLEIILNIISAFNLDLADKYKVFYYKSIGLEWGNLK